MYYFVCLNLSILFLLNTHFLYILFSVKLIVLIYIYLRFTKRQRFIKYLIDSESTFRSLFETDNKPLILTDDQLVIIRVNKEFENLTGFRKEEIEGKVNFTDLLNRQHLYPVRADYDDKNHEWFSDKIVCLEKKDKDCIQCSANVKKIAGTNALVIVITNVVSKQLILSN
jgi:PAS domain S-box-containing protein